MPSPSNSKTSTSALASTRLYFRTGLSVPSSSTVIISLLLRYFSDCLSRRSFFLAVDSVFLPDDRLFTSRYSQYRADLQKTSTVFYDAWYMLRYFCLTSYNLMLYPTQVFGHFQKDQCQLYCSHSKRKAEFTKLQSGGNHHD